jgi:glycosyltransferase involved in cell wall biosynthesis
MKVLHITNSIDKSAGGPARSVPQTCVELARLGISIELVTQESNDKVDLAETTNLTVSFRNIWELFLYGSRLSSKKVDIIHLQHIWNPYIQVMAFWAYHKKIPYIVTPRGMLEPWIMANNPWKKKTAMFLYQRKAIQRAVHIHATGEMEKRNIQALGFSNPIAIIPNGIDLGEVKSVKKQYGSKKMVFLSRIHPKKGIELLLEAWRESETMGWTLNIAGDGDATYVASLSHSAQDLGNVHFVGPQYGEAKWDFLLSADVMVLPTYSENFGIVVAEALAIGVPVITTKETPWEDLKTYQCGWWIDLSVSNLKIALSDAFCTSNVILESMGTNGKKLIKEKYEIKSVGKKIFNLYQKILNLK